jgi:hypothetical protein
MTAFELSGIIISLLTFIVALLAFLQSSLNSIKSLSEADRANKMAEQALLLAQREAISKSIPVLKAFHMSSLYSLDEPEKEYVSIILTNTIYSKATIVELLGLGIFNIHHTNTNITVPFNDSYEFTIPFREEERERMVRKVFSNLLESQNPKHIYRELIWNLILESSIYIKYIDEFNKTYETQLRYNTLTRYFEGNPIPLN